MGCQSNFNSRPSAVVRLGPFMRFYAALLADGQQRLGRIEAALDQIRRALETVDEPGVGFFVSELYRVQGLCLLQTAAPTKRCAPCIRQSTLPESSMRPCLGCVQRSAWRVPGSRSVGRVTGSICCASSARRSPRRSTHRSCARRGNCFRQHASPRIARETTARRP